MMEAGCIMKLVSVKEHYDLLVQEGNDPANDPPVLQKYMDKYDGKVFIDALSLTPKSRVMEIGVGTGRLAKKVLQRGCFSFTGIDISPATIDKAKFNLRSWDNVLLINDDFFKYPFRSKFDIIYCSLTFFHFEDKRATIENVVRILNKAGTFVLAIPVQADTILDFGTRQVKLYPDDLEKTKTLFAFSGLKVVKVLNVELATILVAQKMVNGK